MGSPTSVPRQWDRDGRPSPSVPLAPIGVLAVVAAFVLTACLVVLQSGPPAARPGTDAGAEVGRWPVTLVR